MHIYGPVPSRRLGFSLGIDVTPFKSCSFDCIYCQLGSAAKKTIRRKEYFPPHEILAQVKKVLASGKRIDYITFSGSGEPTLYASIGKFIKEIKKITTIPVAVLTNSSFLSRRSVRNALLSSNLVVPSLDAATQDVLIRVNRPHQSIKIEHIIDGLKTFRLEFEGSIWLEIMLVKGVNDSASHIRKLKEIIGEIKPDKVQLNTVIRPPAEKFALALSLSEIQSIKKIIGKNCEIIAEFGEKEQMIHSENLEESILSMIQRRPVTLTDLSVFLGKHQEEVIKYLSLLLKEGKIKSVYHKDLEYYEAA